MKRRIAALLALALMLSGAAWAEAVMAELRNMRKSAGDRILEMEAPPTPEPEADVEPTPTPEAHYALLEQGMKGDAVKALQRQLIALGHLSGAADGSYGGQTAKAVKAFQQAAGLEATGIADEETQRRLFWTAAPIQRNYEKLNYDAARSDADACSGAAVKLSGKALQVMEDDAYAETRGVYTVMRVATKGSYDDVVYVTWFRPVSADPILEGDSVSVRGVLNGLYTYVAEAGDEISLPRVEADAAE